MDNNDKNHEEPAYKKRNIPNNIYIKGYKLSYKEPPLKGNIYVYRCRVKGCNYFLKIDKENLNLINGENNKVTYSEFNQHSNHKDEEKRMISDEFVLTDKEVNSLAVQLIKSHLKEGLEFHIKNFITNKINWSKGKIRKLLYSIREETFPKDEAFLNYINQITIKLNNNNSNTEEAFCIYKGDFINFHKKNKLERVIIFSSQFQLNLFKEINELYIDGTFKVSPKNWFQLLNIFGYIKNKNIYIPLSYIILSSKDEELYTHAFNELINAVKNHCGFDNYGDIKVMTDFEISLRKSVKNCFKGCILQGCCFHYCKAVWKKIKKYNLFKKNLRLNTMILSFALKAYPFVKEDRREKYLSKIEIFCTNLKGNYIKLYNYFIKYWKYAEIFNFTKIDNNTIKRRTNNICESFHRKINKYISHYHPKCSYLVEQLKIITKDYYEKYISNLSVNIKINNENEDYLSNDICNFIKKFISKHNENLDIDSLN